MKTRIALLSLLALLGACSAESPDTPPPAPMEGRAETQTIRNTEHIGVSGDAIANRVDGALDAAEKKDAETKAALESTN